MSAAHVITGASRSFTVTTPVQLSVFPAASATVNVTVTGVPTSLQLKSYWSRV